MIKVLFVLWAAILFNISPVLAKSKHSSKEILFENDKVLMLRKVYPAGSESGMHTHIYPFRTVYFIKGGKLELVPADKTKKSKKLVAEDGRTLFLPATTHNVKNIGDTEIIVIETELK